ncbi:MAG TPA: peptidase S13 [Thiolapillus brandeum]|uniref:Peptidase S13 n=1 Tax=Thiolapillus brandeum TaxID=1076588 RepID=A0A831WAU5_9GAMM|nr:peptidase S13 [Thiolapillus brandeum]
MIFRCINLALVILLLAVTATCASATDALSQVRNMPDASLLLLDGNGEAMVNHRPEAPRIPASTLKILTAWLAIDHWGLDHRFATDFFLDGGQVLWVKGYGDPMLVSEEIERIAVRLKAKGLTTLHGIRLDGSYFAGGLSIDGRSDSSNPYDAPVAALAANFNTVNVRKTARGILSAEPQTPLTDVAREIARNLKNGRQRVNIRDSRLSARYFGEILQAKLQEQGIEVTGSISNQPLPGELPLYYRHMNSHTLEAVLRAMLRYSTNFIANQLFLALGAEVGGAPADFEKSRRYARQRIASRFHWQGFTMVEGSGLSRRNRISARQMVTLLEAFRPYRGLLPSPETGIQAKTGTLKGISCYAGYLESRPFALFINQPAAYGLRLRVARELLARIRKPSAPVR